MINYESNAIKMLCRRSVWISCAVPKVKKKTWHHSGAERTRHVCFELPFCTRLEVPYRIRIREVLAFHLVSCFLTGNHILRKYLYWLRNPRLLLTYIIKSSNSFGWCVELQIWVTSPGQFNWWLFCLTATKCFWLDNCIECIQDGRLQMVSVGTDWYWSWNAK